MARLHTSFILGYHGCGRDIGEKILAGHASLTASDEEYDWLGPSVYFWESDPVPAWEWADAKVLRGSYAEPFVIGAVIDLGNCLDMLARDSLEVLSFAYDALLATTESAGDGRSLPANRGADEDKLLRFLDCAVIRYLHQIIDEQGPAPGVEPFDSVRGLFTEGEPLYAGSGFKKKTHVQIAVRNADCVKGYFRAPRLEI